MSGTNENAINSEVTRLQIQLKNMLSAQKRSPVFEFQDDDFGVVMINVQSYNFIVVRAIENHEM